MAESYEGNYLTDDNALSVYNSDSGATTATVKVLGNKLTLSKDSVPTELNLEDADKDALGKLVTAINKLGNNWVAALLGPSLRASKDLLVDKAEIDCLLVANIQTLKTIEQIVTNWPAAWEAVQKRGLVQEIEEMIEKITKDYFYEKAFLIERNGNGKNELNLGLNPSILSVSKVEIFGVEIESSWYTHDKHSVYIDLTSVGAFTAEYKYRLRWSEEQGIFTKGIRSVRITGTYGHASCPEEIRRLVSIIIMDRHDSTLYDHWIQGTQSISGDFRYDNPNKIYTGITIADHILKRRKKKKVIFRSTT